MFSHNASSSFLPPSCACILTSRSHPSKKPTHYSYRLPLIPNAKRRRPPERRRGNPVIPPPSQPSAPAFRLAALSRSYLSLASPGALRKSDAAPPHASGRDADGRRKRGRTDEGRLWDDEGREGRGGISERHLRRSERRGDALRRGRDGDERAGAGRRDGEEEGGGKETCRSAIEARQTLREQKKRTTVASSAF